MAGREAQGFSPLRDTDEGMTMPDNEEGEWFPIHLLAAFGVFGGCFLAVNLRPRRALLLLIMENIEV
jgi:hypothetical protein